jgi:hypothetical protein
MMLKETRHWQTGSTSKQQHMDKIMFSTIYKPKNGTIELYTTIANHKEAIDWARLSTSDIAKELNDKSMEEIFINPKDAYDKLAVQPDWKPHTLAKQIENLVTPDTIKNQGRRKIVAMSYDQENTQGETTAGYNKPSLERQSQDQGGNKRQTNHT